MALVTVGLAWVTVRTSAADRRHDDVKRAEDRTRDDRLRQEQLDQLERREQAERTARRTTRPAKFSFMLKNKNTPSRGTILIGASS